ncbi:MAG: tRNA lysidine(34) synthetase TilS [Xanthobacteraceae bacterium]|nr:tRNA lysidine(34) synthetase TilS [Xanthobacteraceae bacterium]
MSKSASAAEPVSVSEARHLFADFKSLPVLVLAVSGGPDSVALLYLAARWRRALRSGPQLIAATVDHGLRTEAAREAREVKRLAAMLGIDHRTLKWSGVKPRTGIQAAARQARYDLLAGAARKAGASAIVTAHTQDDQAETILMRLSRGSGIAGLAAMARHTRRDGISLLRPFLDIPKDRLIVTLQKAKINYAQDPSNNDPAFTRPRLRALMPALAAEGADARALVRLAARLSRANAALDVMADGAQRYLWHLDLRNGTEPTGFDLAAFSRLSAEIRVRLLMRELNRVGHEGPAELGKAEVLIEALDRTMSGTPRASFKQSLAGAVVSVRRGRLHIEPAPPRRSRGFHEKR